MKITPQIEKDFSFPFSEGDSIYTNRGEATFLSSSTLTDAGLAKDVDGNTFAVYFETIAHTKEGWKYKVVKKKEDEMQRLEERVAIVRNAIAGVMCK